MPDSQLARVPQTDPFLAQQRYRLTVYDLATEESFRAWFVVERSPMLDQPTQVRKLVQGLKGAYAGAGLELLSLVTEQNYDIELLDGFEDGSAVDPVGCSAGRLVGADSAAGSDAEPFGLIQGAIQGPKEGKPRPCHLRLVPSLIA